MSSILLKILMEGNQSKTLKFENTNTIADVIKMVETKSRIPHDPAYAIYIPSKGVWADNNETLGSFGLDNMSSLEFRKKTVAASPSPPSAENRDYKRTQSSNLLKKWVSTPSSLTKEDAKKNPATAKSPRKDTPSTTPALVPSATEIVLRIEFPEETVSKTVKVELESTIGDLVSQFFGKKAGPSYKEAEDYAFFTGTGKTKTQLASSRKISSCNLTNNELLVLERFQIRVRVSKGPSDKICFVEKPDCKVQELLSRVIATMQNAKPSDYYFYLPSKHSGGVKLDPTRTVLSYRMTDEDVLELKKQEDSVVVSSKPEDNNSLFLVVESPSHGVIRTLQFAQNMTVAEAISRFIKKNPVQNSANYGLFVVTSGGEQKMDSVCKLSFYQLKNKDKLIFKELSNPAAGAPVATTARSGFDPTGVFGVDPSTLEQGVDRGFTIPKILILMRKSIYRHKGLMEEGIFRIAGEEGINNDIKRQLNQKIFKDSDEVHSLATLLKRWFGELPKRIFSGIPPAYFNEASESEEKAMQLPSKLSGLALSMFQWFVSVILDVAFYSDINKMTCANIAIVVGPSLSDDKVDDPILSLTMTSKVVNTLQRYFTVLLKEKKSKNEIPVVEEDSDDLSTPRSDSYTQSNMSPQPSPSPVEESPRVDPVAAQPTDYSNISINVDKDNIERESIDRELAQKEKLEKERLEKEKVEQERLERERIEREKVEKDRQEVAEKARQQRAESASAPVPNGISLQERFASLFGDPNVYNLEEQMYMLDVLAEDLGASASGLTITCTGLELLFSLLHDAGKDIDLLDLSLFENGIEGGLETLTNAMAGRTIAFKKLICPNPTAQEAAWLVNIVRANPQLQLSFRNATSYRLFGTALKDSGMATRAIEYYRTGMELLRQQKT